MRQIAALTFATVLTTTALAQIPASSTSALSPAVLKAFQQAYPGATFSAVGEKDLPKPVAAAIRSHRRAIYVSGVKVTRGASVEYHLTVRGSRKTAMIAKPDGTVISFK